MIYTKETFSQELEEYKYRLKTNYLECILYICEKEKIDVEYIPKLLTKQLKKKIEEEMNSLNMFKKVPIENDSI